MKSDDKKVANITPFGLRLQPDLKRRVEEAARASGNSLNAEIAMRLEASFAKDDSRQGTDDQVNALRSEVDELREDVRGLRSIVNLIIEVETKS
ncbi:Arc family DNA-binding protein [Aliihoeflea sp. 2WW]|uniref:Arc family DNA-binding protein n=1 Tax=Aliihoeflea sp. 2WW TaxID=1381123 RepID=UPI00244E2CF6|nr:Arc family DNA-binding protein [Aliihoeflea sp. 2WW]